MRYRLRTLLIVLAILPPFLAVGWWKYAAWKAEQERRAAEAEVVIFYFGINGLTCTVRRVPRPVNPPGRVGYNGSLPEQSIPGGVRLATAWCVRAENGHMIVETFTAWSGGGNPTLGPGHPGSNPAATAGPYPFGSVSDAPLTPMGQDMGKRCRSHDCFSGVNWDSGRP